jgi:phenylalanyl-tRNA synthetase beta chain
MAALGYQETVGWSFISTEAAGLFGGGAPALRLANPIASELDCMRPSALPGLIEAAKRNLARGLYDLALFEIGPIFLGDRPEDQRTVLAAILSSRPPRRWDGRDEDPLFALKGDLYALLGELGVSVGSLQVSESGLRSAWRPGQAAKLQLGPKTVLAEFGAVHPQVLKALDAEGPLYGFELVFDALPESRRKGVKSRPPLSLSTHMPLSRDFAFIVGRDRPAADLVRAALGADKGLIASARVFDVYQGPGVAAGEKSVALEVVLQPKDKTLTDAEIEAVCARIITAVEKGTGGRLRN